MRRLQTRSDCGRRKKKIASFSCSQSATGRISLKIFAFSLAENREDNADKGFSQSNKRKNRYTVDQIASFILIANKYPYSILSQLEKLMDCFGIISQKWILEMAQSTTKELLGKIVDSCQKELSSEDKKKKLFLEIQIACNSIHQHLLSAFC